MPWTMMALEMETCGRKSCYITARQCAGTKACCSLCWLPWSAAWGSVVHEGDTCLAPGLFTSWSSCVPWLEDLHGRSPKGYVPIKSEFPNLILTSNHEMYQTKGFLLCIRPDILL